MKSHKLPAPHHEPLIDHRHTSASITDKIAGINLTTKTPLAWIVIFLIAFGALQLFLLTVSLLISKGVGIWGLNIPVGWAFDITNFVWWVGIGHAGTLISAILLLMRQEWRTSINRFAEAMTLFAVACAGLFPLLHLGRHHLFYWLMPYPNVMALWPNFRSPLVWDVFAVSTYATVSLLFWYVGLIPDLGTMRDQAKSKFAKVAYGLFALGWRGSARHWSRHETASLILAGLATPLVLSVHTIVGFDFAVSVIPGWHTTIFPPYFVAGAIYSGFAMVVSLAIPARKIFGLEDFITMRHLDYMARVMLATCLMVGYGYTMEAFIAWYSAAEFEVYMMENRAFGPMGWSYWLLILFNILIPQLLWFSKVRMHVPTLFIISIIVNIGMWLERFVIIVTSLYRDFLPSSWGMFIPTFWDWATFIGTVGFFVFNMLLFLRFLPSISMYEMRHLREEMKHEK